VETAPVLCTPGRRIARADILLTGNIRIYVPTEQASIAKPVPPRTIDPATRDFDRRRPMPSDQSEVLRVTPMYEGNCRLYIVENLRTGGVYQVDTLKRTCTCDHKKFHPYLETDKHLAECDAMEERQKRFRSSHPTAVARAKSRVTGVREIPRYPVLSDDENEALKAVFA
jgi:hypothetical protein